VVAVETKLDGTKAWTVDDEKSGLGFKSGRGYVNFRPIPDNIAKQVVDTYGVQYEYTDNGSIRSGDGKRIPADVYERLSTDRVTPPVAPPIPAPTLTPAPTPKEKGFMDKLFDNKGMGGGIIGAIIGWLSGSPLGGDSGPAMSAKLKTAVTEYAKVRFTDLETGVFDQKKVDTFVQRYESMVAKNMTSEEQDKRAGEIEVKTTVIKGKLREAAASPDASLAMENAVKSARETMKATDKELIKLTDASALPPIGAGFTAAGVKIADRTR
jgi:hypothetical protein